MATKSYEILFEKVGKSLHTHIKKLCRSLKKNSIKKDISCKQDV